MLKKKIMEKVAAVTVEETPTHSKRSKISDNKEKTEEKSDSLEGVHVSRMTSSLFFKEPLWKRFYELECVLNNKLKDLKPPAKITHIYNPIEYASAVHCDYLRIFLDGPKSVIFVGMNPGPNGMAQTGVPFGNIRTVRDFMELSGTITKPTIMHPKRPVNGFDCKIEEPSGVRIWNLFKYLAGGNLLTFARQCFVHNFCPLVFYNKDGKNLTPSELMDSYKLQIRDICLETFEAQIQLIKPEIIIPIGDYVFKTIQKSKLLKEYKILKLPHPSPRSLNNHNWPEKAEKFLNDNDLIKFIRSDVKNITVSIEE